MKETLKLAIMFADISGSTKLYEQLGDTRARDITSRCLELMSRIIGQWRGRVVKTIGDEIMCTFPTSDNAARAAVQMQEDVDSQNFAPGVQLQIRVGFHFGEVIQETDGSKVDVFGDAVNLAARMAAQAKASQIITTGESIELMSSDLQGNSRMLISTVVKGKAKPVDIYELTWGEEEELTVMGGMGPSAMAAPKMFMKLSAGDNEVVVNQDMASVTIGRGSQNNLMVPDNMASRLHAKVEFRRDRFMLVDQSTNGTYMMTEEGETVLVHRDERALRGNGYIGLGQKPTAGNPLSIRFVSGMA
ncbi:MAG: adenylate/guanylate cyclase domain-containing protein [Magnetococcales bacterium]|nr:adenylate/guanylate cyclase domain-containing protein [Magnetococcales bacterium]